MAKYISYIEFHSKSTISLNNPPTPPPPLNFPANPTTLQFLEIFFGNKGIEITVPETNKYADRYIHLLKKE